MACHANAAHSAHGLAFPVREYDHDGTGWRNFDDAGRACAAQQSAVPGGNPAQGKNQDRKSHPG
jgi:hypothetical protein